MDVTGLAEARRHAEEFHLPGSVDVLVPTLENFLALKLLAWRDRHVDSPRHDAVDIDDVLSSADDLIDLDTLYDEHHERLSAHGFDPGLATLDLLGSRWSTRLEHSTRDAVLRVLDEETNDAGSLDLVRDMRAGANGLVRLRALRQGSMDA